MNRQNLFRAGALTFERTLVLRALFAGAWPVAARSGAAVVGATFAIVGSAAVAANPAEQPPAYTSDAAQSRLEFTGEQAGAPFKGAFHAFTATVTFAPEALAGSRFDVQIVLNSLDSGDKDRDQTLRGPDLFDIAHFPSAHYVTRSFTKTATGYSAQGTLTLRGVSKDVPIDFQFVKTPTGAKLEGTARLKRLDFGVGQGDWKSTEWVKDDVRVAFSLVLKPAA